MENIDVNKLLSENRGVVVIIAIALLSVMIAKNIYTKQMAQYENIKAKISAEQEKNEAVERIVLLNEILQKQKERSWDTVDFNAIVEKIFNLGLECNIKIRDVSPGEKRDEPNYVAIPFTISAESSYGDLMEYIKRMEKLPMLMHIKNVTMNPIGSQDVDQDVSLGVGMGVEAIYLK
ncbi:MAG: type 4a pilus biogenesis protein PilO [Candidatus Omnitrophota bacterium]